MQKNWSAEYKKNTAGINLCAVITFFKIKKSSTNEKSGKTNIYNKKSACLKKLMIIVKINK